MKSTSLRVEKWSTFSLPCMLSEGRKVSWVHSFPTLRGKRSDPSLTFHVPFPDVCTSIYSAHNWYVLLRLSSTVTMSHFAIDQREQKTTGKSVRVLKVLPEVGTLHGRHRLQIANSANHIDKYLSYTITPWFTPTDQEYWPRSDRSSASEMYPNPRQPEVRDLSPRAVRKGACILPWRSGHSSGQVTADVSCWPSGSSPPSCEWPACLLSIKGKHFVPVQIQTPNPELTD